MESIRILHASDLHIANIANLKSPIEHKTPKALWRALRYGNLATSYDPTLLKAFADFVLAQRMLNAILITGDIATTGDYPDLVKAHRFIEGEFSGAWFSGSQPGIFPESSICKARAPIWLLPGNHDRFIKRSPTFYEPGGVDFHRVFSKHWAGDVRSYPLLKKDTLAVAVIGADFSLRNSGDCGRSLINKYSQGRVYEDVLEQLELQTNSMRKNYWGDLIVLWAMHFPPDYPKISARLKLLDSSDLISSANKCGVAAVLTGHTHKRLKYSHGKMRFDVFCAGTVCEFRAKHGHSFQIINISANNLRVDNYEFDRTFADFRLAE